jgi:hypothetical protein
MTSFLDRFPEARHIAVDGAMPPRGNGRTMPPRGRDQTVTPEPGSAPLTETARGFGEAARGFGERLRGRDQSNPSNLSAPNAFRRNINGRDQTSPPSPRTASPSYAGAYGRPASRDQEEENGGGGAPLDAGVLLSMVQLCLKRLSGAERTRFIGGLSELLGSAEHLNNGQPNGGEVTEGGNGSAFSQDRRRRMAGDRALINRINGGTFETRWGELTKHIQTSGYVSTLPSKYR